jgi:hypothetical protein
MYTTATARRRKTSLPKGWSHVSEYCIRNGDYTICKIGGADGLKYELWHLTEQMAVNLLTLNVAIEVWHEMSSLQSRDLQKEGADC